MKRIGILIGIVVGVASLFFGLFGSGACGRVMAAPDILDTHIESYDTHVANTQEQLSQLCVDVGRGTEDRKRIDEKLDILLERTP